MIRWENIAASAEDVHTVVNHRSGVEVSIRWRASKSVSKRIEDLNIGKRKWTYVWTKLHCIVLRSKQCTSQENWSTTSSKPPKMYILLPTMHALWPSRAPGKLPLTSGVSHSRVRVSKENRISHTCRIQRESFNCELQASCITHHLIVSTTENVTFIFVCNSRVPYNDEFSIFLANRKKFKEKKQKSKSLKTETESFSCFGPREFLDYAKKSRLNA